MEEAPIKRGVPPLNSLEAGEQSVIGSMPDGQ